MERYAEIQKARWRVFRAFVIAPAVAWTLLYATAIIVEGAAGAVEVRLSYLLPLMGTYILGLAVTVPLTAVVSVPVYRLLRRMGKLSVQTIVPMAFLEGALFGYLVYWFLFGFSEYALQSVTTDLAEMLAYVLAFGICGLIGGIVFCRMTIWRKRETDEGAAE